MKRLSFSYSLLTLTVMLTACSRSPSGRDDLGEDDDGIGDFGDDTDDDLTGTDGGDATGGSGDDTGNDDSGESDGTGDSDEGNTNTDDGETGTDDGVTDTDDGSTGTDSGSTDDSGTDDGSTEPEPCQVTNTTVEPLPPNVMLVLDKSGSMSTQTWDHDGMGGTPEISRWESLHAAVNTLVTNHQSAVKFGAKLFPRFDACGTSNSCGCPVDAGVEAECAINNASGVLGAIPASTDIVEGGTPTATGLDNASTYLQSLSATEPRAMVLIADGEISCNENFSDALGIVTDAVAENIPTYVIGIDAQDDPNDSDDAYDQLTALANAGDRPNPNGPPAFYQTQNQADLETAMSDIIADALSCVVAIDPEPQDASLFQVWIEDTQIPLVSDCSTEDGWVWTQDFNQIELCGTACDDLKASGEMEGRYFCRPG